MKAEMNKESMTKLVGIILAIMWVSQVLCLFPHPFQKHEGIRKLATDAMQVPDWTKQESPIKDKTADELEKRMMTQFRIEWVKSALFIVIGVLSGLLLIQRRKGGYLLAFFFSLLIIGITFVNLLRYRRVTFSLKYHEFMLRQYPVRTILDLSMQLVLLATVIFLIYIFATRKPERFVSNPR